MGIDRPPWAPTWPSVTASAGTSPWPRGGMAGYSRQTISLLPCISSSISLHNTQTALLVLLSILVHCRTPVAVWPHGLWVSGYLQSASVAWNWAGLWTFPPSCTEWQDGRLASLCLWPVLPIQQTLGLWASLSASGPQQWQLAGLGMSYSNNSVLHEVRQGPVCPVPARTLQSREVFVSIFPH